MYADGSFAVALVKNQVMVVRTSGSNSSREKLIEVHPYSPFGEGVFLASDIPSARISASDILTVLPPLEDNNRLLSQGMLELPKKSYSQYMELSSKHQKRYESLWSAWVSKKH
ncbi:hypothetical protein CVT24_005630 [Panaeolus cyanescens]|uniref:Uncharacterized protein n=1 Tax=Panaeolus cyanescens TaxID=181874 RepID=A0A409VD28_9AGAR|nr:hypothetical protein CVT24_005630 [Panaeolus cyanescens]